MNRKRALVVVDVQNDFCSGGTLAVKSTRSLIGPLNEAIAKSARRGDLLIFTQDWHPPDHSSFMEHGGPWPSHCVEGTEGAEFCPELLLPQPNLTIRKGEVDSSPGYSAFENPKLLETLQRNNVGLVLICGIALEYCVQATCLDSVSYGFETVCITSLTRAVEQDVHALEEVMDRMSKAGVLLRDDYEV